MPLHSVPVSRRQFLASSAAALAGLSIIRVAPAALSSDVLRLSLLSDTHVEADPAKVARNINMTDNLRQVVKEVLAQPKKPDGVLVNGDVAFNSGRPGDYENFAQLIQPLLDAKLPLHLTMGNHDARDALYGSLANQRPTHPFVESKHITLLETPVVNLFLLDSLTKTNVVTGEFGKEQLEWLAKGLDARADKPAVIIAHHPCQFTPPAEGKPWGGLADTGEFIEVLKSRPQVKAFIFGHTHVWGVSRHDNLHMINLPPTAYIFKDELPNGWVAAEFTPSGLTLQLNCLKPSHPEHQKVVKLDW